MKVGCNLRTEELEGQSPLESVRCEGGDADDSSEKGGCAHTPRQQTDLGAGLCLRVGARYPGITVLTPTCT